MDELELRRLENTKTNKFHSQNREITMVVWIPSESKRVKEDRFVKAVWKVKMGEKRQEERLRNTRNTDITKIFQEEQFSWKEE